MGCLSSIVIVNVLLIGNEREDGVVTYQMYPRRRYIFSELGRTIYPYSLKVHALDWSMLMPIRFNKHIHVSSYQHGCLSMIAGYKSVGYRERKRCSCLTLGISKNKIRLEPVLRWEPSTYSPFVDDTLIGCVLTGCMLDLTWLMDI